MIHLANCRLNRPEFAGDSISWEDRVMKKQMRYSPEVRERAAQLLHEHQKDHESQWAAILSIASKIGCSPETLRSWVRQSETDQGIRGGLSTSDRERLKELERENRELKRANEILWKAYYCQLRESADAAWLKLKSFRKNRVDSTKLDSEFW